MAEDALDKTKSARHGGATAVGDAERLPVLSFLNHSTRGPGTAANGFVGALIVGAVALVVALMALTVAIGRAPNDAAAQPQPTAAPSVQDAPTTYASPEQTGTRWTPQPIITGVPQNGPSYDESPSADPESSQTPETPAEEQQETRRPGEMGMVTGGVEQTQAPGGEASVVGRGRDMAPGQNHNGG